MKTKIIFTLLVAILLMACNNTPYPEQDAKLLIQGRVKNCVKVDKVYDLYCVTYVAVDSAYNTFSFNVSDRGELIPLYKNGK